MRQMCKYIKGIIYIITNLSANPVWRRPQGIVFFCDFTVVNDSLQLFHHTFMHIRLGKKKPEHPISYMPVLSKWCKLPNNQCI